MPRLHTCNRRKIRNQNRRQKKVRKMVRLGMSYGMGVRKMTAALRRFTASAEEAREAVASFRAAHKRLRKAWRRDR